MLEEAVQICRTRLRDERPTFEGRFSSTVLTPDADETARVTEFLSGMAGNEFGERFTVGEADDIVREVEGLAAAGIDCLIFNMPLSDPETVERVGDLLVKNFA
jgi:alkanesulfonate monooxygenase SsuD/methylene tetrahydromethanopterin reductase-like flavin-dependent oxidoreductase (luciferase family)